jgi:Transcriptional regulators
MNGETASDGLEYLSRIRSRYDVMSKSQRKIANYIQEHKLHSGTPE